MQLSQLSSIRERDRNFVRSITRHATPVQYDNQGRIPISDLLINYALIKKDIKAIGMIKKIELWDPNTLIDKEKKETFLDDKGFNDLADEINF